MKKWTCLPSLSILKYSEPLGGGIEKDSEVCFAEVLLQSVVCSLDLFHGLSDSSHRESSGSLKYVNVEGYRGCLLSVLVPDTGTAANPLQEHTLTFDEISFTFTFLRLLVLDQITKRWKLHAEPMAFEHRFRLVRLFHRQQTRSDREHE